MKRAASFVVACVVVYAALCAFSVWAWMFALGRLARLLAAMP